MGDVIKENVLIIAVGVMIGVVVPNPYRSYIILMLAAILLFLVLQIVVVLVRSDTFE